MTYLLFFLVSIILVTGKPAAAVSSGAATAAISVSSVAADSVEMLEKDWVLRQVLRRKQEAMVPVLPVPHMRFSFQKQNRYEVMQYNEFPNVVNTDTVVEQGAWELQANRALIGLQVSQLSAHPIKSMLLTRWPVIKLKPTQLVLRPLGKKEEYLVFEPRTGKF